MDTVYKLTRSDLTTYGWTPWLIWDHVRGVVEPHAIFPWAHKLPERKGQ